MAEASATYKYELPKKLENLAAILAEDYDRKGKVLMRDLLVKSDYEIEESYDYDNWNGGQYGHMLHLKTPSTVYFDIIDDLAGIEEEIKKRINDVARVANEWICGVTIEIKDAAKIVSKRRIAAIGEEPDTLAPIVSTGALENTILPSGCDDLWKNPGFLRVFLSHKAEHKVEAAALKNEFVNYGVTCFVAHEDIEPTRQWQGEIEKALLSMEVLVALLTPEFHDSNWTDQEVGVAIGRQVPVIPVKLGRDPYGFIGKYQAFPGYGKAAHILAKSLFEIMFAKLPSLEPRVTEALVARFESATSYRHANTLMGYLNRIDAIPAYLIERLEKAPEKNDQVAGAFKVENGLPLLLKRLSAKARLTL